MQYLSRSAPVLLALLLAISAVVQSSVAQEYPSPGMDGYPSTSNAGTMANGNRQTSVPGPPTQPTVTSRPASWPGGQGECSPWAPPNERVSPAALVPQGEIRPCDGTRILGRVGSDAILESEVAGSVNEMLEANKNRIPPDQVDQAREMLTQRQLKELIQVRLIYQDAKRTIPAEGLTNFEKQLTKVFEEGEPGKPSELERMIKKAGAATPAEFDQKLHSLGTSLEQVKRAFVERMVAGEWRKMQVKGDEEITYDQMLTYYREHVKDFTTPARAQWEELMVRYSKYPTRAAACEAIARMGNQVLAGAPLAEVAKAGSDGTTAGNGGQRNWTTKGGLECEALDTALFGLPVGRMSPIIEGPCGYHIIRVTNREDQAVKPFVDAQTEIKQKIAEQRSEKQKREYMAKLETRTPVWTIFDSDIANPQLSRRPPQSSQR